MKKIFLTGTLALALGIINFILGTEIKAEAASEPTAYENTKRFEQANPFHEGEKPIQTIKDEKTGVTVDVYNIPEFQTLAAGTWDRVGIEQWYMNGDFNSVQIDGVYYSSGGDYMVRVPRHYANVINGSDTWMRIELWEDDPYPNEDENPINWEGYGPTLGHDYVVRDIGKYVDGTNSKAEFYTKHQANYTVNSTLWVEYYD